MTEDKLEQVATEGDDKYKQPRLKLTEQYNHVITKLELLYPSLFSRDKVLPLKKGIVQDIKADVHFCETSVALRKVLYRYTQSVRYLKAVKKLKQRYDLEGNVISDISPEDLEFSERLLATKLERRKIHQNGVSKSRIENIQKMNL